MYTKYKATCENLKDFSMEFVSTLPNAQAKIRYLFRYFCLLVKAWKGRREHRDKGFVPGLFDPGHEAQFAIIEREIVLVEDLLSQLYEEILRKAAKKTMTQDVSDVVDKTIETSTETEIIAKVQKFKKQREDDAVMVERALKKYMDDNKKYFQECERLQKVCYKNILRWCNGASEDYEKLFSFYQIVGRLHTIGYFVMDYKPEKCCCGNCPEFAWYDVRMTCSCFEHFDGMRDFLADFHIDRLTNLLSSLQNNEALIEIARDFNALWKKYEVDLIDEIDVFLNWDVKLDRMCVKTIHDKEFEEDGKKIQFTDLLIHSEMDKKCQRFGDSEKELTNSIIQKWRSQSMFVRYLNGERTDLRHENLEQVRIMDAMLHVATWVVDWDMQLTPQEEALVRTKRWRKGLKFSASS